MQVPERIELLHAPEVEQRVAADDARHVPQRYTERESEERDRQRVPRRRSRDNAERKRQGDEADDGEHDERQEDRAMHDKDEEQRGPERAAPPGDRSRSAAQPPCPSA